MTKYDLIAVGDCTIDAFVRLHEASVNCSLDKKKCQLCLSFADKVPYETLDVIPAVGNASNVAVGISRLGFKTAIITAVGDDYYGKQILETYKKEGVGRDLVKVNKGVDTNYHFVLNFQAERTILIKHHEYSYPDPSLMDDVEWVYFSSIGENTIRLHEKIADHICKHPNIKMGFNPGTFQMKLGIGTLREIYKRSHVLFLNREEAQRILNTSEKDVKKLMASLHDLGPKIVVITDGPDGAYASDGAKVFFTPPYPDPKPPFERTGAGDAFSTGFMGALMANKDVGEALKWGAVDSMSVVQYTGAQRGLLTRSQLTRLIDNAPSDFSVKEI